MKSEFMREFDFQYEKTPMWSFPRSTHGAIASKATALNIAIPGWVNIAMKAEAEDALRRCATSKRKMVAG
jgi:hypothetical protein